MKSRIKHRYTGATLFEGKYEGMRACVVAASAAGANLTHSSRRRLDRVEEMPGLHDRQAAHPG